MNSCELIQLASLTAGLRCSRSSPHGKFFRKAATTRFQFKNVFPDRHPRLFKATIDIVQHCVKYSGELPFHSNLAWWYLIVGMFHLGSSVTICRILSWWWRNSSIWEVESGTRCYWVPEEKTVKTISFRTNCFLRGEKALMVFMYKTLIKPADVYRYGTWSMLEEDLVLDLTALLKYC